MSQALYDFLGNGFKPRNLSWVFNPLKNYMDEQVVDEYRDFDTMFIYCDVIDSRVFGDATALLLATLPNSNRHMSFGDVVTTRFVKIRYYPVAKCRFHTTRIDVRTDVSRPVGFEGGQVFVELLISKKL